jgi:hypothetical protein
MKNIKEHIKQNQFKPVYLLYGQEAYLKNLYKNKLKNAILGNSDEMNFSYFEGKSIDLAKVIEIADTVPFFHDKRLIIIENSVLFKSQNDLADYIKSIPETTHIIFVENEIDKRNRLYKAVKDKMKENQFPYTPATTLLFGLKESLRMIADEGLEKVWSRHEIMALAVRNAIKAMGLKLFAEEGHQSNTVTAIVMPDSIKYKDLSELLRTKYGVVIGGGLGKLQGKIFRIGHLGSISNMDTLAVMGAVEMALYELGYKVELGTAAKAVAETLLK